MKQSEALQKELDQKNQQIESLLKLLDHEQHLRMIVEQKLLPDTSPISEEAEENKQENLTNSTEESSQKNGGKYGKKRGKDDFIKSEGQAINIA